MTDRKQLQRQLAEYDAAERRYRELQRQTVEADERIDEAVEVHQKKTAAIRQRTANPDAAEQAALDDANAQLEQTCKRERARITQLQAEAIAAVHAAAGRGQVEHQLIESARAELRNEKWHLDQELLWLEARRNAAKKAVVATEAALRAATDSAKAEHQVELDRWRVEFAQADAALAVIGVEREELRQRMLRE